MWIRSLVSLVIRSESSWIGPSTFYDLIGRKLIGPYSPDLHSQQTTSHLANLLLAPINSYQSVLTLLALPNYVPLLSAQPFVTRRMLAHAIVSSVLKNETVVEDPEDVHGILELCQVLIREQSDAAPLPPGTGGRRGAFGGSEREDVAEEQGWIARMVHLFRSESLGTQFEVRICLSPEESDYNVYSKILQTARRHLEAGGDRMRFTFPAVITSAIKLCRRYKNREHLEDEWAAKVEAILKFVRQLTSILATQVDAPAIALRLFLLAAQIADECGFEDLAYDLYVEAFTVYEEGISESRAQLQAITLVIGTLQGARVFGADNYDTLITKAALHGAKLLKKPHQASAVHLASHMWWQETSISTLERADLTTPPASEPEKPSALPQTKDGEDGADAPKAVRGLVLGNTQRADGPCSIRTKTASVSSSVFKSRSVLPTQRRKRSLLFSYTSTPSINIYSTWTVARRRFVLGARLLSASADALALR
jgi:vacuolar protein sorting-associated protein 35